MRITQRRPRSSRHMACQAALAVVSAWAQHATASALGRGAAPRASGELVTGAAEPTAGTTKATAAVLSSGSLAGRQHAAPRRRRERVYAYQSAVTVLPAAEEEEEEEEEDRRAAVRGDGSLPALTIPTLPRAGEWVWRWGSGETWRSMERGVQSALSEKLVMGAMGSSEGRTEDGANGVGWRAWRRARTLNEVDEDRVAGSGGPLGSGATPVTAGEKELGTEISEYVENLPEELLAVQAETVDTGDEDSVTRRHFLRTAGSKRAGTRGSGTVTTFFRAIARKYSDALFWAPPGEDFEEVDAVGGGQEMSVSLSAGGEVEPTPREGKAGLLRRRAAGEGELTSQDGGAEDDDEDVDGFGSVGLLAFLVCFGLLFCVMEVAKCYCLFECRRRQRLRRRREQSAVDSEGRLPVAVSRPVRRSVPEEGSKGGWVEVVIDGVSMRTEMPGDEKVKDVPSAKGYAVADASHALQEAIEHAQRLSPSSGSRVMFPPAPAGPPAGPPAERPAEPPQPRSSPAIAASPVVESSMRQLVAPATERGRDGGPEGEC